MEYFNVSMRKIACGSAACFLFLTGAAAAVPSIQQVSGTLNHKSTVTITGSGFGSKSRAAPVVWDDATGNNILDKWDGAWPNNNPTYNTTYRAPMRGINPPHNHITKYIAGAHGEGAGADGGYNVIFFKTRAISSYPAYTYLSYYDRADDNWVYGGDNNFKTFFSAQDAASPTVLPNWYLAYNTPNPSSPTSPNAYIFSYEPTLQFPDANGHDHWWDEAVNPMSGVWTKIEMEIKYTDQSNGYIKVWENGVLRVNYLGHTHNGPPGIRTEGIGGYARMYNKPSNWRYWADVYFDYSLARGVLANNANLDNASIIELQIPSAWSPSSITVTVNLGKFMPGQTAYLFVFDPTGVHNTTGFPVTVGGGGGTPLAAPTNLRVM